MSAFGGVRGGSASRERNATRNALVVVQVALALVLVVGATLMTRTFQALRDVHPGFVEAATIQTVRTWAPNQMRAAQYIGVQHEILDAIAACCRWKGSLSPATRPCSSKVGPKWPAKRRRIAE
jgi:hypothetical protein